MILIVTQAAEINKAKKTKAVIMVFFGPDVGFVKPLPAAFSCHCFKLPPNIDTLNHSSEHMP